MYCPGMQGPLHVAGAEVHERLLGHGAGLLLRTTMLSVAAGARMKVEQSADVLRGPGRP